MRFPWQRRSGPVYVVAGGYRSGTTMMMQALEAGGMTVARAPKGHEAHAFYELELSGQQNIYPEHPETGESIADAERYPAQYQGRLIKALLGQASHMYPPPEGIVCVWMSRDLEAIRTSYAKLHPGGLKPVAAQLEHAIDKNLSRWRGREDTTLVELDYDDVLANPIANMDRLHAHGFPINSRKAAAIIDPSKRTVLPAATYRARLQRAVSQP